MTTYKTLEEVQKDYPNLDVNQFTYFQRNYLLNNEIKTIDEDYNINCINCRYCKDCMDCEDCINCRYCISCTNCIDCLDCENCKDYANNKPIK